MASDCETLPELELHVSTYARLRVSSGARARRPLVRRRLGLATGSSRRRRLREECRGDPRPLRDTAAQEPLHPRLRSARARLRDAGRARRARSRRVQDGKLVDPLQERPTRRDVEARQRWSEKVKQTVSESRCTMAWFVTIQRVNRALLKVRGLPVCSGSRAPLTPHRLRTAARDRHRTSLKR